MGEQLQLGQQVTVSSFGGKQSVVIVVKDRGDVILVCNPQEFKRATAELRAPLCIGMRREDVLDGVMA